MLFLFKDIAVEGDRIFWTVTLKNPSQFRRLHSYIEIISNIWSCFLSRLTVSWKENTQLISSVSFMLYTDMTWT